MVGIMAPITRLLRLDKARAAPLGIYPSFLMAASTAWRVESLVVDGIFNTRETLAVDTPASAATSKMLTTFRAALLCKGFLNLDRKRE